MWYLIFFLLGAVVGSLLTFLRPSAGIAASGQTAKNSLELNLVFFTVSLCLH